TKRLCKSLGPFEPRRLLARPERLDARAGEIIDDSRRKRRFRTDHDELDLMALAEIDHRGMIGDVERHTFGLARNAGIARRAPEFGHQRRGRDLPRQSVFAAAGTEQKNVHKCSQGKGAVSSRSHESPPRCKRSLPSFRTARSADPESRACLAPPPPSSRFRVRSLASAPE